MKLTEELLQAIKHKGLNYFRLTDRKENGTRVRELQLSIKVKLPFIEREEEVFILGSADVCYSDRSYDRVSKSEFLNVCFLEGCTYSDSHVRTFLKSIKKDDDIVFKVVICNNNSDMPGFNHHQLFAIIQSNKDMYHDKTFFLSDFYGMQNSGSPVSW